MKNVAEWGWQQLANNGLIPTCPNVGHVLVIISRGRYGKKKNNQNCPNQVQNKCQWMENGLHSKSYTVDCSKPHRTGFQYGVYF